MTHWAFEGFILLTVLWSCATLTLDSNALKVCAAAGGTTSLGDCRARATFLTISDRVVLAIFLVGECRRRCAAMIARRYAEV